jgi:2-polyprenyl-6-hydroxyphenyl methylase/3-demethylubiquinone-9 3-methyltransferase
MSNASRVTVDPEEDARFAAQAGEWWNPDGSFRALHRFNPVRLAFIREALVEHFDRASDAIRPFTGLSLLDIGCGGGLVAEPMARLGFTVTGIDANTEAIAAARAHAEAAGLTIDYRVATAESLAEAGEMFDAALALEVIEHVADVPRLLASAGVLTRPGGAFVGATINRTARAFALAIVGAEYLAGWLPRGTHDWRKLVRPSELVLGLRRNGLWTSRIAGIGYDFAVGEWSATRDLSVNYILVAARR